MITKRILIIVLFIIFGYLLRLYFATHAYPNIVFDAKEYVDDAQEFLRGNYPIDPHHKNMGYSVFLALLFWLRGSTDIEFVKFVQILLDCSAGILIWIAAKKAFSQKIGDIAFILYLVNPFTSSYVGIILPEVCSSLIVAALLVLVVNDRFKKNIVAWFLMGFFLGLLLFAKPSFVFFTMGLILVISFLSFHKTTTWIFLAASCVGLLLASSYTLILNYTAFGKIAVAPPYSTIGGQTYVMSFYADRYPEVEFWGVAPRLKQINAEFANMPNSEIPHWNKRYFELFFTKLAQEPINFLAHFSKNLFWLWDKDHLSVYEDPWYPQDRYILRVINLVLLVLCIVGIIKYAHSRMETIREPFMLLTVVFAASISLQFPLVSNESRHTIPFYPLLFFWVAYAVSIFYERTK